MSLSRASSQFRAITKDLGELVETHERAKGLDSFQKYEDDLPGFAWEYFKVRLWSKQIEVWEGLLQRRGHAPPCDMSKGFGDPDGSYPTASHRSVHG